MTDWTEKHRPRTLDGVLGNPTAVNTLRSWARQWENGIPEKRAVVLMGSPGVGKTTSAEALAREMGWDVVEMNASDQRSQDEIERVALRGSMFDSFGEDGSFGASAEGRRKLIILDEADSFFGREDRGAIPAVAKLIRSARQPVILIVNDFAEIKKNSTIKNGTLQITFKKTTAATMSKALRAIADAEGVDIEPEALAAITENASGDMRAAVRNLQALAEGADRVTLEMAQGLSRRDSRSDMYALMTAVFRKNDPAAARVLARSLDEEPSYIEIWVDENMPYEYPDRGDLIRGYEALCRADIYLGRVGRRQYYGFWSYASDMMTMGVAAARMSDRGSRDKIRFPMYLSRMSKSKSLRALKKASAAKIAGMCHTSIKRAASDIVPELRIILREDPEMRVAVAEGAGLEPEELAFIMGLEADSPVIKEVFKATGENAEERRIRSQAPRAVSGIPREEPVVQTPSPAPHKASKGRRKAAEDPKPQAAGQRSLFDFRGYHGPSLQRPAPEAAVPPPQRPRGRQAVPLDEGEHAP